MKSAVTLSIPLLLLSFNLPFLLSAFSDGMESRLIGLLALKLQVASRLLNPLLNTTSVSPTLNRLNPGSPVRLGKSYVTVPIGSITHSWVPILAGPRLRWESISLALLASFLMPHDGGSIKKNIFSSSFYPSLAFLSVQPYILHYWVNRDPKNEFFELLFPSLLQLFCQKLCCF